MTLHFSFDIIYLFPLTGVYFEKMLKDGSSTPFWVRNLQMYLCGIVSAGFSVLATESDKIMDKGFFYGYDWKVASIVGWFFCKL